MIGGEVEHEPVRPDGLGVLRDQAGEISFWLEVDLGTETLERLEEKMDRSARVSFFKDLPHAVLFCFHSEVGGPERDGLSSILTATPWPPRPWPGTRPIRSD